MTTTRPPSAGGSVAHPKDLSPVMATKGLRRTYGNRRNT